jgi:hypothetical protein
LVFKSRAKLLKPVARVLGVEGIVVLIMFIVYNIVPKGGKAVPVLYGLSFPREAVAASSPVFHSI